jgi:hypothetical protein
MRFSVIFTFMVLLIGSLLYFAVPGIGSSMMVDMRFLEDSQFKSYLEQDAIKIFAYAPEDKLSALDEMEGKNRPSEGSMVIGNSEAMMMIERKLITGTGSSLQGFFGIDTGVGGILMKTDTIVDDIHFLSIDEFNAIDGERNIFVIVDEHADIYYTLKVGKRLPFAFSEGSIDNYRINVNAYSEYYPVILGSKEAEMMRKNKDFSGVGDVMNDYHGYEVFIAGILEPTGGIVDMMHFIPLSSDAMKETERS